MLPCGTVLCVAVHIAQIYHTAPCRDSVHLRLFGLAADQARRLQDRREVLQGDAEASAQHARLRMSWISEEMMRERTAGPFDNYGGSCVGPARAVKVKQIHKQTKGNTRKLIGQTWLAFDMM